MDTIDDSDFGRQRISLMILSIAIIMYVVGGGHIGDKGAIFGGTIKFDNTDVILWTGFLLYVWFNWMLMLSSKPHMRIFLLNFKYFIHSSAEYKKIAADFIGKLKSDVYPGFNPQHHLSFSVMYHHGDPKKRQTHLPPQVTNVLCPDTLFFNITDKNTIIGWDRSNIEPWRRITEYPVPDPDSSKVITKHVPLLKMYWIELKCLHNVILFHKPFAFVIAPFFLSAIAAGVLLWDFGFAGLLTVYDWLLAFGKEYYKIILVSLSLFFVLGIAR